MKRQKKKRKTKDSFKNYFEFKKIKDYDKRASKRNDAYYKGLFRG